MNVQPVSFMPVRDAKALTSSMDGLENRVEPEAFSRELERKVDRSDKGLEQKTRSPVPDPRKTVPDQRGQASAKKEDVKQAADSDDKEVKPLKSELTTSKVTKKETKEERLKKFMDSLESEFQIPPTRIVEAFSQLTPQELSLPADESIDRVVSKLNLEGESAEKVKYLYGDLVQDLGNIDASAAESSSAQDKLASVAVLGLAKERFDKTRTQRNALQKSLDQMNQSFWQPQVLAQTPPVVQPELISKSQMTSRNRSGLESYRDISMANGRNMLPQEALGTQPDQEFIYDPKTGEIFANAPDFNVAMMDSADRAMINQTKEGEDSSKMMAAPLLAGNYSAEADSPVSTKMEPKTSVNGPSGKFDIASSSGDQTAGVLTKMTLPSGGASGGGTDFFSKGEKNVETKGVDTPSKKASGDDMKAMLGTSLVAGSELKDNSLSSANVAAPIIGNGINQETVDKNIQNVFQQAKYLVKNGGGEMKVKMTPEGLGEIQLSVELKDGRVQLQMVADNKETKKMLESNLSELKESLSQQKIALDSVKIDSVVRTNVENQAQGGNHFNQNQNLNQDQRETRQFWNQFQDQFGGRPQREMLFEPPKAKGYASKKSETIAPAETTQASQSKGKSKGLNLVA